jgi:hypothetical protein
MMVAMQSTVVLSVVAAAAVLVSSASASIRVMKPAGRVSAGDKASVTIVVSPRSRCTIVVYYSTTRSEAKGLGPKRGTTIVWTWTVGSATKSGRWPIKIDCGSAGKARTSVLVR